MQTGGNDFYGAVKIKDGLFMGDMYAAQDAELLITNKITHVVNCAGRELANHWESIGIHYLTLTWQETNYQTLFEGRIDFLGTVYKFIETALNKGESVLIHSLRGQNRCACAVAAYCMKKYRWTLNKTLEFLQSRKPNVTIRPNFLSQLLNLENKLALLGQGAKTEDWNKIGDNPRNLESDELLITNTFLNSKQLVNEDPDTFETKEYKSCKLMWADQYNTETKTKPSLVTVIPNKGATTVTTRHKYSKSQVPVVETNVREEPKKSFVKSILKGSDKIFFLEDPSKKEKENSAVIQKVSIQTPTGRKVIAKLRPGSAITAGGGSSLTKSSSTSVLEKISQDGEIPTIQGNIVHITVNNFIANNGRPSSAQVRNEEGDLKPRKVRKPKLFMSSSTKDLGVSESELANYYSSMTSDMNNRNNNALYGKPGILSQSVKFNNFTKDSTADPFNLLAVFGSGASKSYSNEESQQATKIMSQSLKGFKMDESKPVVTSSRTANSYTSTSNLARSIGQGRSVPIRVINDIDISNNPTNFLPKTKKYITRPLTAPNKAKKKELQTSPYYNPDNYFLSAKNSKTPTAKIGGIVVSPPGTKTIIKKIGSKKGPVVADFFSGFESNKITGNFQY